MVFVFWAIWAQNLLNLFLSCSRSVYLRLRYVCVCWKGKYLESNSYIIWVSGIFDIRLQRQCNVCVGGWAIYKALAIDIAAFMFLSLSLIPPCLPVSLSLFSSHSCCFLWPFTFRFYFSIFRFVFWYEIRESCWPPRLPAPHCTEAISLCQPSLMTRPCWLITNAIVAPNCSCN